MNTNLILGRASVLAASDIAKQLFVGLDGNICGAGKKALGVSELDAAAGEMATVIVSKIALVNSGAALASGAPVTSDASGKAVGATTFAVTSTPTISVAVPAGAVPVTSDAAQPNLTETASVENTYAGSVLPQVINGYALDAATGADQLIRVLLV